MIGIMLAKIKRFIREPWTFIIMTIMTIGFASIIGYSNSDSITIPVYSVDDHIRESIVGDILTDSDALSFKWMSEDDTAEMISSGKAEVGVELLKNDFRVLVGVESPTVELVRQTVESAYTKKIQYQQLSESTDVRDIQSVIKDPVFTIETTSFRGSDANINDNTLQPLFGFTLFFVIYTIAYNVFHILEEKTDGIWDRVILSPVKKWEMYVANFLYSFITGYLQVVITFSVFRYWIGVDFNGNFAEALLLLIPYVFAIVALAILITGFVKTVQQFNAAIPIIAVSMAMIGGAYWPLEIVQSEFMLTLAKFVPITYGMEVLNGVAVYGYSMSELLYPISILLLMGVIMTGIGIHLMEKRHI
ncbi:ABC transporter permease [Lentibacillus sp. Marseille-P4043]|uniref:ABC transporter permease n=1 Tax=Lentibacillus sp. Marseille-P4043 TaxID=2040293 RepID=UPI000D0B1E26|nr:ABC transporter permease [Lentibacillus sp. Marseille-P4043]